MIAMLGIAFDPFSKRLKCSRYLPPPTNISSDYCYQTYGGYQNSITYVDAQAGVTLGSLLIILGVVELIVALASSIYGCQSCRCNVPAGQVSISLGTKSEKVVTASQLEDLEFDSNELGLHLNRVC